MTKIKVTYTLRNEQHQYTLSIPMDEDAESLIEREFLAFMKLKGPKTFYVYSS